jgi:hypothetical protein
MLCAGVTGVVKEAIETLQESGATTFVLDILNNRSVAVNALKHIKSRSKMCMAMHIKFTLYELVGICLRTLLMLPRGEKKTLEMQFWGAQVLGFKNS